MTDREAQLAALRERREQARHDNFLDVKEEATTAAAAKGRAMCPHKLRKWREVSERLDADEEGRPDPAQQRALSYTIEEVEVWQRKQELKAVTRNAGVNDDAESIALRKVMAQVSAPRGSHAEAASSTFVSPLHPLDALGKTPSSEAVRALAEETKATQSSKSRRKDKGAVDYISERNRRFNRKAAKAYDPYTTALRASLERGSHQ